MAEVRVGLYLWLTFARDSQSVRTIVKLFSSFSFQKIVELERYLRTLCDLSDSFS